MPETENSVPHIYSYHGRTLKNFEKACKINGFMENKGVYYTTTEPFREEA